jgi:hypothetical protein
VEKRKEVLEEEMHVNKKIGGRTLENYIVTME